MQYLETCGTLRATNNGHSDGFRVDLDWDFGRYYRWLILIHYHKTRDVFLPKHGIHVTIANAKDNPRTYYDIFHAVRRMGLLGKKVKIRYNIQAIEGGSDFTNYYFLVDFPEGDRICDQLGIRTPRWHITIGNDKTTARPAEVSQKRNEGLPRG